MPSYIASLFRRRCFALLFFLFPFQRYSQPIFEKVVSLQEWNIRFETTNLLVLTPLYNMTVNNETAVPIESLSWPTSFAEQERVGLWVNSCTFISTTEYNLLLCPL